MKRAFWSLSVVACALALIVACTKSSPSPAAPSSSAPASADAGADGSTLKATAPTLQSPINGAQLTQGQAVTLVVTTSTAKYASGVPLSIRFEVTNAAGAVVETALVSGDSETTSRTVAAELEGDQAYQWRARAEYQGAAGPWSASQSFVAPANNGYIRGGELYDPLINGKTVGEIHGPVTFIPGVGLRLDSQESYVTYQLGQTVTQGEFSVLISNIGMATSGLKTKVFSMSQGGDDITVDRRRFTIEKRGGKEPGSIAWRVIASEGPIETIGAERLFVTFNQSATYLWRATWAPNSFRLIINEGGVTGRNIYNYPRALDGTYDPSPHFAYLGSPPPRGGPDSQSVPGIVLKQVWLSSRPRPSYTNQ